MDREIWTQFHLVGDHMGPESAAEILKSAGTYVIPDRNLDPAASALLWLQQQQQQQKKRKKKKRRGRQAGGTDGLSEHQEKARTPTIAPPPYRLSLRNHTHIHTITVQWWIPGRAGR
ncbi:hypothetical protein XENOCAPTIV_014999 [Xenoophorus captivus]|uniref:Uncharacterized protein n=1 Tax=Xenoophorus captivus TaxID=1517983 RepID=A0ABV0QRX5_9TELE